MAEYNTTGATLVSHDPHTPPEPEAPELPTAPPIVVDAPYAWQQGNLLNCTMGNWQNEPTLRVYQWRKAGVPAGPPSDSPLYGLSADDVGASFDCLLTAANAVGQAQSTSNVVVAVAA